MPPLEVQLGCEPDVNWCARIATDSRRRLLAAQYMGSDLTRQWVTVSRFVVSPGRRVLKCYVPLGSQKPPDVVVSLHFLQHKDGGAKVEGPDDPVTLVVVSRRAWSWQETPDRLRKLVVLHDRNGKQVVLRTFSLHHGAVLGERCSQFPGISNYVEPGSVAWLGNRVAIASLEGPALLRVSLGEWVPQAAAGDGPEFLWDCVDIQPYGGLPLCTHDAQTIHDLVYSVLWSPDGSCVFVATGSALTAVEVATKTQRWFICTENISDRMDNRIRCSLWPHGATVLALQTEYESPEDWNEVALLDMHTGAVVRKAAPPAPMPLGYDFVSSHHRNGLAGLGTVKHLRESQLMLKTDRWALRKGWCRAVAKRPEVA